METDAQSASTSPAPSPTGHPGTTTNPGWGFYGTMAGRAEQAWPIALATIARTTAQPEADVVLFLDSRYGRHFADEVGDYLHKGESLTEAIESTAAAWQGRRIGSATSKHTGIPKGLPSLTAFVCDAAIAADSA